MILQEENRKMRELKFRAWDGERYLCDGEWHMTVDGKPITYDEEDGYVWDVKLTVEQYTGLKDKNGREIYEGDIVTLNGEWEEIEHGDCSIVTFENGCFRVGNGYENEAGSYLSDWRIIGNIHENPELLKEKE